MYQGLKFLMILNGFFGGKFIYFDLRQEVRRRQQLLSRKNFKYLKRESQYVLGVYSVNILEERLEV